MSDSLTAEAVSSMPPGERAIRFLESGGDLIIVGPGNTATEMAQALATHAAESDSFRRRIDEAVLHVLEMKEEAGLLPCGS